MKDPFLKPVILGGILIALLSVIFAPGIFLWAITGGYLTVKAASKALNDVVTFMDGLLLGVFSGILGGVCLDMLAVISFNTSENHRLLLKTLEMNWPKDIQQPLNINAMLPSILFITCILIILISVIFSVIGSSCGVLLAKKKMSQKS